MTYCKVFKNSEKWSFNITQQLLKSVYTKARTAKKKGMVVITIPTTNGEVYTLECVLTKDKIC